MQRYTHWAKELDRARKAQTWIVVDRTYNESTARQIASDIRGNRRINGIKPGETWDAQAYAPDDRDNTFAWIIEIRKVTA